MKNSTLEPEQLRQRADYTHKYNSKTGRHGWLRLTPAYSVKVVEQLLEQHRIPQRIFDPFCGTGTTALSAAYHGHEGVTTDINPFLLWLANAKTKRYSSEAFIETREACKAALELVARKGIEPTSPPEIHNIERWWSPASLEFLCLLRSAILASTTDQSPARDLLLISFCRSLIDLSNASFNHQSMSFKNADQMELGFGIDMSASFLQDVDFVLRGAGDNPSGTGRVVFGDSRNPSACVQGLFDLVITSPPYVNRMSYIRELRPYMYWLEFLSSGREAGELDWTAIGGTWGIATSRLNDWQRADNKFQNTQLEIVLDQISNADNKSAHAMSNYVAKYFDDMWAHFQGLTPVLAPGAEIHYIVGNSSFYGTLVSTELLYADMLNSLGFQDVQCNAIRKRNSKKELIEFDVFARWERN
jgi:D12 class N6 adenine-specific DNA methyltransferase